MIFQSNRKRIPDRQVEMEEGGFYVLLKTCLPTTILDASVKIKK
jgi:hypothetical protein